ncbi:MAG TPA: hypothetical protein VIE67_10160 [Rudaea sp.]|jgi:hypothetical protein|uniref:hypothetical protein n=1 Tax=Rudaea sp. TaxID=2136325 RepID=UPI002F956352
MAVLPAGTAAGTELSISMPQGSAGGVLTTLCTAMAHTGAAATCMADIRAANLQVPQYTIKVVRSSGSSVDSVAVNWAGLLMNPTNFGNTFVTGPGQVGAGASFQLRMLAMSATNAIELPVSATSSPGLFAAVLFDGDGNKGQGNAAILPLAWSASYAFADKNRPNNVLNGFDPWNYTIVSPGQMQPGQTMLRAYFDLPPNSASYAPITVSLVNDYYSDLDWTVEHVDFPGQSASPQTADAPTPSSVMHGNGNFIIDKPRAGRWYIYARNTSTSDTLTDNTWFQLSNTSDAFPTLNFFANIVTPTLAPGLYYNAQRSGHGVSLSQAGGQQMLLWYTYMEDGTPTWYLAQAAAPPSNSGWWTAPLYRSAWNGSKNALTRVGTVLLTPTAANQFVFTWYLEDKSGSESFGLLARTGACPSLNGTPTNLTGAWYPPALSGSGIDVLALPEQQFDVFYLYDQLGIARWGVGNTLPFLANAAMDFRQTRGFCPACIYVPIAAQPLGSVTLVYDSASSGHLVTDFLLKPPLSGSWNTDQPMRRLTGAAACTQ